MSVPESVSASLAIPLLFHRRRPDMEQVVERVVACFERARVAWCLVGAHAVGRYTEPRATLDFVFLFDDARWRSLESALKQEFPEIVPEDIGVAMRLREIDVDLIRASGGVLLTTALRDARVEGTWRLPPVEDLIALYQAHREAIDRSRMMTLASKVYRGAEVEFGELIDQGLPISL